MNSYDFSKQSDPDQNRYFRGWDRQTVTTRDPVILDRLADAELAHGHYAAADRLAWLAAGLREAAR